MSRIAVIGGAGYVGASYAAVLAELGHEVTGLDLDARKVGMLSRGEPPIHEPGLGELLERGLSAGRLRFTTEYADAAPDAEFAFLTVGTPTGPGGAAEMRWVLTAARSLASYATGHTIVVNKSTMPVGSSELVSQSLAEKAAPGTTFAVVSNPEFLREGRAVGDIFHPDRVVVGSDDQEAALRVAELYAPLGAPVILTDPRSAEMIKYASNAFLAAKISFINEIALICEKAGADVRSVAEGVGADARIGPRFLRAGVGFGGSCFPKDVRALAASAREYGLDTPMLNTVLEVNAAMRRLLVDRLEERLGGLEGRVVAVLGLAFKPDTDDLRDAPALEIISELLRRGAVVRATDPVALDRAEELCGDAILVTSPYAAATGADAVAVLTEWGEYRTLNLARLMNAMRGRLLLDARDCLDPQAVATAGLDYAGIGVPAYVPDPEMAPLIESGGDTDSLIA